MADELMGLRLREAQAVAELKDTKQNFMELETQVGHIGNMFMQGLIYGFS
jgi:hypothetical protein